MKIAPPWRIYCAASGATAGSAMVLVDIRSMRYGRPKHITSPETGAVQTIRQMAALIIRLLTYLGFFVFGAVLSHGAASRDEERVLGEIGAYTLGAEETLHAVAQKFDLGFVELLAANPGLDPWVPGGGTEIVLPTAHIAPPSLGYRIVVNRSDMRLYLYDDEGRPTATWPVGLGKTGWATPVGPYSVSQKRENPIWYPPESIRAERPDLPVAVGPGPANPLGRLALRLGWDGYAIHGTNEPLGVGRQVSHGCIRLYPRDIEALFARVDVGASVLIVNQPIKLAWKDNALFLEVSPSAAQANALEARERLPIEQLPTLRARVRRASGNAADRVDWAVVEKAGLERRGVPVRITPPAQARQSETISEAAD